MRNFGYKSFFLENNTNNIINANYLLLSKYSETFFSSTIDRLKNENLKKLFRKIKKHLARFKKKKKLVLLTQKLNKIKIEKIIRFPLNFSYTSVLSESPKEALIY